MFSLGSRKYIFFPFFFADCCPPGSVNGTRCVPPGQLEPSRQLSWAELPGAGTEPKDTKKPGISFACSRVWVSPLCQDLLSAV